jgi:hypothetical protein
LGLAFRTKTSIIFLRIKLVKRQIHIKLPKQQRWNQVELSNQIQFGKWNCQLKQKKSGKKEASSSCKSIRQNGIKLYRT